MNQNFVHFIDDYAAARAAAGKPVTPENVDRLKGILARKTALEITTNHRGKMEGNYSISTLKQANPLCMARAKDPTSICAACYVDGVTAGCMNLLPRLINNTRLLTESVLHPQMLPSLNCNMFRVEAFGDVINKTHAINYINLAAKNPLTTVTAWTKNPGLYDLALQEVSKPDNMIIILSCAAVIKDLEQYESEKTRLQRFIDKFDFIDKIFIVMDTGLAESGLVNIVCGDKKCVECRRCYNHACRNTEYMTASDGRQVELVLEKLKK